MNRGKIITLIDRNKYNFKVKKGVEYKDYTIKNQELIAAAIKRNDPNITIKQGNENHEIVFDYNMKESDYSDSNIQPIHPRLVGYCPLTNVGNSCYMNSAIQLLYSIPQLKDFLYKTSNEDINRFTGIINHDNDRKKFATCANINESKIILQQLKQLFEMFRANPSGKINIGPANTVGTIYHTLLANTLGLTDINGKSNIKEQSDASEFITKIFEASQCFNNTLQLAKTLSYLLKTTRTCNNKEGTIKTIYTTYINYQFNIYGKSIQELINKNLELMPDEVDYKGCNKKDAGTNYKFTTKKDDIELLEEIDTFIFSLKRFVTEPIYNSEGNVINFKKSKISNRIVPDKYIQIGNVQFIIQGIIVHSGINGGINGGHYVYVVYDNMGEPNIEISDDSIGNINMQNVYSGGYVYYYRRI